MGEQLDVGLGICQRDLSQRSTNQLMPLLSSFFYHVKLTALRKVSVSLIFVCSFNQLSLSLLKLSRDQLTVPNDHLKAA